MFKTGGILGIIVLFFSIWAILKIIQSSEVTLKKTIWIVVILVLPVLGLILWWFFGPKSG